MCSEMKENNNKSNNMTGFNGLNSATYTWNINDNNLVQKILKASNEQLFESDPFSLSKLQWILLLYPNGNKKEDEGSANVFLKLLSMPIGLDKIVVSTIIKCNQTYSSHTYIKTFTKSGGTWGWSDRTVLLSEWNDLNCNRISITVSINIVQLQLSHNHQYLEMYRLMQPKPDIQTKSYTNESSISSTYKYVVNDQNLLTVMKKCQWGKQFESSIFDNIWKIQIKPSGPDEERKDYMAVYFGAVLFAAVC